MKHKDEMIRLIGKRLALAAIIVWGVLTLTFFLIHLAPGDFASMYLDPEISKSAVENIRDQMGFNRPIWQQYLSWMGQYLSGNFGISFSYKRPVIEVLSETIPNTLRLTVVVFVVQMVLGSLLGIAAAIRQNSRFDHSANFILLLLYSTPGFWLALLFIFLFSYKLGWLPSSQMFTLGMSGGFWLLTLDRLKHLILPALVLVLPLSAYTARFVRGSMCEVLTQKHIRTAFAYGLSKRKIYFQYALKNAMLPLTTLFGLYLPFLLGGAVITEYIFGWPGMGRLTIDAIFTHDYPVILATTFVASVAVVVGNLLSDLLYGIIDPRISFGRG